MGLFKNILSTVTSAVSSLAGTATSTVTGMLPAVSAIANTSAGLGALSALTGKPMPMLGNQSTGELIRTVDESKKGFFAKLICMYKMDPNGLVILDANGKKQLNIVKILITVSSAGLLVFVVGKKKRWF